MVQLGRLEKLVVRWRIQGPDLPITAGVGSEA